jgi:hypothetical protein
MSMVKKMKSRAIGLLVIALFALSLTLGCGKVAETPAQPAGSNADPNGAVKYFGSLSVEIRDAYTGMGLQGAKVRLEQISKITGGDGVAIFQERISGSKQLSASMEGYHNYSGRVEIIADKHIYLQVDLVPKEISSIDSESSAFQEIISYALSDRSAFIVYKTSSEISEGLVCYGKDPDHLESVAANLESGKTNSATLMFLDSGSTYFYRIKCKDASGNMLISAIRSFSLPEFNLALGKAVSGTFDQLPPNDTYVNQEKDVLSRAVDGVTGYFQGMATSGSIGNQDQEVTIDLGGIYPLNSIISYWRSLAYPENFCVRLSKDKLNWSEVRSDIDAGRGAFARSDAGDPMRVVNTLLGGMQARYLQILIKKGSPYYVKHSDWDFVQLMEVEVFSDAGQDS